MNTQPAWGLLVVGALIVVALIFSPIWLQQFSSYIEEPVAIAPFPEAFYLLSNQAQDVYNELYQVSPVMAQDLVAARLATPVDIEEPNLPALDPNPEQVVELLVGDFITLDAIRLAVGTVHLYRLSDGRTLVRLNNLDAVNGPDMRVLLSAHPRPSTREELDQVVQYEIDLGALKGNQGNQNYVVTEPTFNIDNYQEGSIVLYSMRYDLVFSYASLVMPSETR